MTELLGSFWTTVGSAGALNQADLAKVSLHQSIIRLGLDVATTAQVATAAPRGRGLIFPTIQAVARYNVHSVGYIPPTAPPPYRYSLRIRFRGHITAKLMQVNIFDGTETEIILFDSTKFPTSADFQTQRVDIAEDLPHPLAFDNNAFYVEAALITPAVVIGEVAAININHRLANGSSGLGARFRLTSLAARNAGPNWPSWRTAIGSMSRWVKVSPDRSGGRAPDSKR
jgi:hypothetical protein